MYNLIDLGSNTLRFGQYEIRDGRIVKVLDIVKHITISQYIQKNIMAEEGIGVIINSIRAILEEFSIDKIHIIATASLRNCENAKQIVYNVKNETGMTIEVLSGNTEATLSFLGAYLDIKNIQIKSGIFMDVGGGSSEVVAFNDNHIIYNNSFNVGCNRINNLFLDQDQHSIRVLNDMYEFVLKKFSKISSNVDVNYRHKAVVSGGTGETFKKLYGHFYFEKEMFDIEDIDRLIRDHLNGRYDFKAFIKTFDVNRAPIFIPGVLILRCIIEKFNISGFYSTNLGIREGFLHKKTGAII